MLLQAYARDIASAERPGLNQRSSRTDKYQVSRGRSVHWIAYTVLASVMVVSAAAATRIKVKGERLAQTTVKATQSELLEKALELATAHGAYKQVNARNGRPVAKLGRTPGSACAVIRFLTSYLQDRGPRQDIWRQAETLAEWVIGLQVPQIGDIAFGGVPSTPDRTAPGNSYYYSIDAAICADAMLRLHALSGREEYLASARSFADFLVAMYDHGSKLLASGERGFCEFVVRAEIPKWNCNFYVKNLLALPVLSEISRRTGERRYSDIATRVRPFLVSGLDGGWEYADVTAMSECRPDRTTCPTSWRRIQGSHGEPDTFVYGDTIAYGLRGLFEYEGPSDDVVRIYKKFADYRDDCCAKDGYDGRIAWAGYFNVPLQAPDRASGYYDLVTLGILHDLKKAIVPEHFDIAHEFLIKRFFYAATRSWKVPFNLKSPMRETIDLTTIAALGEALLLSAER